jgi:hypothetical protein
MIAIESLLQPARALRSEWHVVEGIGRGSDRGRARRAAARPGHAKRFPAQPRRGGGWWTTFPPPPGFDGEQSGVWGYEDYYRACTPKEQSIAEAREARDEEEEHRCRDAYFARLK